MAWSMKKDRQLIDLARANLSVEQFTNKMRLAPATVVRIAMRLGLHLPPIAPKRDGRLKAKQ
jgi:hypothetical protein